MAWLAVAVATVSVLPYWSVLPAYFVSDDFNFVWAYLDLERPVLPFVWDAFTRMRDVPAGFYRPLPFVTLWLEFRTWGTWMPGFHLTNLLLHALVTMLVYAVGRHLSGRRDVGVAAAGAALFYGIHPRRVETVAWLSCRPDLLATLLALGSFWAFLCWNDARRALGSGPSRPASGAPGTLTARTRALLWLTLWFVAWWGAIVSKDQALLLPLAYLFVPQRDRPWLSRALPVLPFVVSWPVYFVIRRLALGLWIGGYGSGSYTLQTVTNPGMWLKQLVYSVLPPLEFAHNVIIIPGNYKYFALFGLMVIAALVAVVWRARREPGLPAALVWTLAATVPVVPFHISLTTPFNDRLLYSPATGVAFLLAVSFATFRPRAALAFLVVASVLLPQTVAMANRWRVAGDLTKLLAQEVARLLAKSPGTRPIFLAAAPDSYGGAYMLRNGLWDAARVEGATSVDRVTILTHYLANDLSYAPVQVTVADGTVHVRSIGQAEVLLAPSLPGALVEPDASLPLDRFGQQDVFGRRFEARFRLKVDGDVWVLHPTRLERPRADAPVPSP